MTGAVPICWPATCDLTPGRIKAGTTDNAELLDLSANLGTIEPGKLADIVAMPGDLSQNIGSPNSVLRHAGRRDCQTCSGGHTMSA